MVALRYADGVVMAGDRRATEGNSIAHRAMEKVFPADRYSAVAIAGAAGPAIEMVRLFQVQLEHYEKVEGVALTLEGKANQLAQMVREHLPHGHAGPGRGPAVLRLRPGPADRAASSPTTSPAATTRRPTSRPPARGGATPRTTIKLGYRDGMAARRGGRTGHRSLYEAADEDSATGGPDLVRGIYPLVAVVDADGYPGCDDEVRRALRRAHRATHGVTGAPEGAPP